MINQGLISILRRRGICNQEIVRSNDSPQIDQRSLLIKSHCSLDWKAVSSIKTNHKVSPDSELFLIIYIERRSKLSEKQQLEEKQQRSWSNTRMIQEGRQSLETQRARIFDRVARALCNVFSILTGTQTHAQFQSTTRASRYRVFWKRLSWIFRVWQNTHSSFQVRTFILLLRRFFKITKRNSFIVGFFLFFFFLKDISNRFGLLSLTEKKIFCIN